MGSHFLGTVLKSNPQQVWLLEGGSVGGSASRPLRAVVGNSGTYLASGDGFTPRAIPGPTLGRMASKALHISEAGGGSNREVANVPNAPLLGNNNFTISCWIYMVSASATNNQALWGRKRSGSITYGFGMSANNELTVELLPSSNPARITIDTSPFVGGFKHYAFSISGLGVQPYVNGEPLTPTTLTSKDLGNESDEWIWLANPGTSGIDYQIWGCVIRAYVAKDEQIKREYQAGLAMDLLPLGLDSM